MALTGQQEEAAHHVASDEMTNAEIADAVGISERQLQNWKLRPAFMARVNEVREEWKAAVRARGIAILEHRVNRLNATRQALLRVVRERQAQYKDHELPEARSGYYVPTLKLVKVYEAGELVPTDSHDELDGQPHGGALKRKRKDPLPDLSIKDLLETGKLPDGMDDVVFEVEDHKGGVLYSAKKSVAVTEWELETGLIKALNDAEKQAAQELGQWIDRKSLTGTQQITITGIEVEE